MATELGSRIRELREQQGITLGECARRAGLSKAYLSQIEKGHVEKPSAQSLYQIATVLGTSVGALLGAMSNSEEGEVTIPRSLEEFAGEAGLSDADKLMLARIRYRGKRPQRAEDWRYLWESIRRSTRESA